MSPIQDETGRNWKVWVGGAAVAAAVTLGVGLVIDPGGNAGPPPPSSGCPVSTMHTPGGPDGSGGCWPGAGNTGPTVEPTDVLAAPGGDRYVYNTTVTIEDKIINYPILVQAGGHVTLRNVVLTGNVDVESPSASMLVEDSRMSGGDWIGPAITGYNYDLLRTDISGGQQPSICDGGCDWDFVYSHNPHYFPTEDAHQSAWATTGNESGVPMSVSNSTLWCNVPVAPTGGGCTANVALQPNFGPVEDVTVHHNLLPVSESSAYCMTGGHGPSSYSKYAPLDNHIVITDNVFGKGDNGHCGVFGNVDNFKIDSPGNVFTGNVFTDGTPVPDNA